MVRKITVREDLKQNLVEQFKEFQGRINGKGDLLNHVREDAIEFFDQLGFPHNKIEDWKYTSLKKALQPEYKPAYSDITSSVNESMLENVRIPGVASNLVVLINGQFSREHSQIHEKDESIIIKGLNEAQKDHPEMVKAHFAQYADYTQDGMTALSTAFSHDGVFIHIPKNKVVNYPVQILHLQMVHDQDLFTQPRLILDVQEGADLKVIENYQTFGEYSSFLNYVTEGNVGPNASLKHYKFQNDAYNAYQVNTLEIAQDMDSRVSNYTVTLGGGLTRNTTNFRVNGENCETNLYGLYMTKDQQVVDNHTIVDHKVPHCESNELYKGIMDDKSLAVFNGKVFVRKNAQKVNAYQSNRNTLLSDQATVNAKPQLEIWADDVKCSHGATSGQLDENQLFYMRARGLEYEQAEALLVYAFAAEVISYIELEPMKDYINSLIADRLNVGLD